MSVLQEQAVGLISNLSDDNLKFLIEFMQRFMLAENAQPDNTETMQAFERLNAVREEIWQYLPADFNPEQELSEARAEKYDCTY